MVDTNATTHPCDIRRGLHIQRLLQAITDKIAESDPGPGQVAGG
jgi:hypothetical protein